MSPFLSCLIAGSATRSTTFCKRATINSLRTRLINLAVAINDALEILVFAKQRLADYVRVDVRLDIDERLFVGTREPRRFERIFVVCVLEIELCDNFLRHDAIDCALEDLHVACMSESLKLLAGWGAARVRSSPQPTNVTVSPTFICTASICSTSKSAE